MDEAGSDSTLYQEEIFAAHELKTFHQHYVRLCTVGALDLFLFSVVPLSTQKKIH